MAADVAVNSRPCGLIADDPVARVRTARSALAILTQHIPALNDDVVEGIFSSDGATAAMLYARTPRPPEVVKRAIEAVAPSGSAADLLTTCVRCIPSARHAVRLSTAGALSVFFPIDLAPTQIEAFGSALMGRTEALRVKGFFIELGKSACGFAVEVDREGRSRARWYAMVSGDMAYRALAIAQGSLGVARSGINHLNRFVRELAARDCDDVVCNVAASYQGLAIKFEFPAVPLGRALALRNPNSAEPARRSESSVRAAATELGLDSISYLGVRACTDGTIETTYYLDARGWLPSAVREAA